jgi:GGDEF domain-containing protein
LTGGKRLKYIRFEVLAVAVVICAVLGTILATVSSANRVADIAGQVLILVALLGGLHYGRKGALISFLVATGLYAIFAFGFRGDIDTSTAWQLFALRTLVFAIVAFIGGELNVRLKYIFMKLEHQDYVDNLTSLYNAQYLSKLIDKHISEFDRYGSKFSLSSFTISDNLVTPMRKKARQKMVRELGNSVIRGNIRGADEAARLEGMKFTVLFPNTNHDGAICASIRIKGKIVGYLERRGLDTEDERTILNEILEYPKDKDNVEAMATALLSSRPKDGSKSPA